MPAGGRSSNALATLDHGGGGPDSDRDRQRGDQGDHRRRAKRAQRIAQVLKKGVHGSCSSGRDRIGTSRRPPFQRRRAKRVEQEHPTQPEPRQATGPAGLGPALPEPVQQLRLRLPAEPARVAPEQEPVGSFGRRDG